MTRSIPVRLATRVAVILTAVLVIACCASSAAGAEASSTPAAPAGATPSAAPATPAGSLLTLGWTTEPDSLNPFVGWASASFEVWCLNYDQLVGWDPKDFSAAPNGLATSWQVSADGKTYTFHLRDGVTWQDGVPFSAADVAFTYNYIVKNHMYAFAMATTDIKEARVVDRLTVQIVCTKPKADLLRIWIPILPRHIWQKVSPKVAANGFLNKPPIVGTGPFQCVSFKKGGTVTMVANPHYFLGAPHVSRIIFQTYQNADTMTSDLKTGEIDAAQGVPQAQFDQLSSTPGITAVAYNYRNWDYLCLNCGQAPGSLGNPVLRDVRFRQALNWAIDKQKLVRIAWSGRAQPGTTILPPHEWFDPDYHWEPPADAAYGYDLQKAEQLLDQSGYVDSNGDGVREFRGKPIVLRLMAVADSIEQQSEARLLVGQLARVGIRARLDIVDGGVMNDRIWNYNGDTYAPDYDMYVSGWDGYFDPGQTLGCFTKSQIGGWNEPIWSDAEFDRLWSQQAVTLDLAERQRMIQRMQQIMYEQSPEIVLTYPDYLQAYDTSRWTGWVRMFGGTGAAFYMCMPDTYLHVRPVAGTQASGGPTVWIGVAVVTVLVVAGVLLWVRRRRREQAVEA